MATRSSIAIITKDNKIKSIYCHSDGYPDYMGALLKNYYNTKEDAKKIIDMADCSFLGNTIEESRFYNVWRNENTKALVWDTEAEWHQYAGDAGLEFVYLFDGSAWSWKAV